MTAADFAALRCSQPVLNIAVLPIDGVETGATKLR
jgi:hypothetical protein